jgi:hypothetical protein
MWADYDSMQRCGDAKNAGRSKDGPRVMFSNEAVSRPSPLSSRFS